VRLPDPLRSYAVLIGASSYHSPEFPDLLAVRNNLDGLAKVLTDPQLGGLSPGHCVVLPDPTDVRAVYRTLRQYSMLTEDTLLVYFAGHGRTGPRNELYLGLADTDPDELRVSALPFDLVREVLGESPATNRVLILDCCFSGRAIPDMGGSEDAILGQVGIEGTYTLTATPANAVALAPVGAAYTVFTGELLALLRAGLPEGPELLTFATIYRRLLYNLTRRGLPRPGQRGTGTVGQLALVRNVAHEAARGMSDLISRAPVSPDVVFAEAQSRLLGPLWTIIFGAVFFFGFGYAFLASVMTNRSTSTTGWALLWLGVFAVGGLAVLAGGIADWVSRRQRLVVSRDGIARLRSFRGSVLLRWDDLSAVEIRPNGEELLLVCTPKQGSAVYADRRTRRLLKERDGDVFVVDLATLRDPPSAVDAALVEYSAGRYRPQKFNW
jgi:Caspase domain